MSWIPTSTLTEDLGYFQIVMNGVDVTFYRNVPTEIQSFESAEPFGDAHATIVFPQITPFEPNPPWLFRFAMVDINIVSPGGSVTRVWEGMVASRKNASDEKTFARTATCVGALFSLDLCVAKPPRMMILVRDTGEAISTEFNTRPTLKVLPCNNPVTGIRTATQSSPNTALLTGYIQSLLAKATVSISPGSGSVIVGIANCPTGSGYWLAADDGTVIAFGERTPFFGTMANQPLNRPISSIAADPQGRGYWLCALDGGVFAFGETFAGSLAGHTYPGQNVVDIEPTPSGNGYWLLDDRGNVYAFGDANYFGGSPNTTGHPVVGMARTSSGNGYWLLAANGAIFAYGDAPFFGNALVGSDSFVAIESVHPGAGYWMLAVDGTVFNFGDAEAFGPPVSGYNLPPYDLAATESGLGYHVAALDGGVFSYGDAVYRGSVPGGGGVPHQWTLMNAPGRQPVIRVKDTWTPHWSVTTGTPGISHDFDEDFTMEPNVIYGEGLDSNRCLWRNTKYPHPLADQPVWPGGGPISVGTSNSTVQRWKQAMHDLGYPVGTDPMYSESDRKACLELQASAGIFVDGRIGAQTWLATFTGGAASSDLYSVYYAPLDEDPHVEQFLYAADGSATGTNPEWDPNLIRVERWENFGVMVSRDDGVRAARAERARGLFARFTGTIRLKSNPEEGSRYLMRAGQNIVMKALEGEDIFFHIAQATVSPGSEEVSLSVDMSAKDLMTLQAIWERDRTNVTPDRLPTFNATNENQVDVQQVMWDCEAGSGVIPRMGTQAGLWNVIRIPGGQKQQLVFTRLKTDAPCEVAMAVFGKPITDVYLRALGNPLGTDYWQNFPKENAPLYALGGAEQPGGYWPGLKSAGKPLTGETRDEGAWELESAFAPWMWVAVWTAASTFVEGEMKTYFPDSATLV